MATTRIEQSFDCDEDTYWNEVFFDEAFNEKLYMEDLGFPQWKVESQRNEGDVVIRSVRIVPKTAELPKPVKKLVGDNIGYREEGRFDWSQRRYTFQIVPHKLPDKLDVRGSMWIERRGEGRIDRILELEVTAKVFGIGGIVEKRIIDDTRSGYEKAYSFIQRRLRGA